MTTMADQECLFVCLFVVAGKPLGTCPRAPQEHFSIGTSPNGFTPIQTFHLIVEDSCRLGIDVVLGSTRACSIHGPNDGVAGGQRQ